MLLRLLSLLLMLFFSCRGDYRKAQWHYNALVFQYNEIVDVTLRLEDGFLDSSSYRAVNEKMDSLNMMLKRFKSTADTISMPDKDDRLKLCFGTWIVSMQSEVVPLYDKKISLWKMMHVAQNENDFMRMKQLTGSLEEKKATLNKYLLPVLIDFSEDYGLSFRP